MYLRVKKIESRHFCSCPQAKVSPWFLSSPSGRGKLLNPPTQRFLEHLFLPPERGGETTLLFMFTANSNTSFHKHCIRLYLIPAGIYLFKVNNRKTRTRCEICSKLTINTPKRRQWRRSGVFIVNFEHISHLVLVFLLLTLSRYMPAGIKII